MTELLEVGDGRIAYEVSGTGPLVVLAPGLGDLRGTFRFLAPRLVAAGYLVAATDLRGHGESSAGFASYSRTDTADDLLALVRRLGEPAVIVGASFSGGAAAIAAALEPGLVRAIVQIGPGTRTPKITFGGLSSRFVKGLSLIAAALLLRSPAVWGRYQRFAYRGAAPADFEEYLAALKANLREPGRMAAAAAMGMSPAADAEAELPNVPCPALVIMGSRDPDFPDPQGEAEAIVAAMPEGRGTVAMIDGAGHYPHAQFPERVAELVLAFLTEHASA